MLICIFYSSAFQCSIGFWSSRNCGTNLCSSIIMYTSAWFVRWFCNHLVFLHFIIHMHHSFLGPSISKSSLLVFLKIHSFLRSGLATGSTSPKIFLSKHLCTSRILQKNPSDVKLNCWGTRLILQEDIIYLGIKFCKTFFPVLYIKLIHNRAREPYFFC